MHADGMLLNIPLCMMVLLRIYGIDERFRILRLCEGHVWSMLISTDNCISSLELAKDLLTVVVSV